MRRAVGHPAESNFGVFRDEAAALEGVVGRLAQALDPGEVWLFGSRAEGVARPDSDFDLLIVAKPGASFGSEDHARVREPLRDLGVGCDVVPCSAQDFADDLAISHSFVAQIVRRGRRVYASPAR